MKHVTYNNVGKLDCDVQSIIFEFLPIDALAVWECVSSTEYKRVIDRTKKVMRTVHMTSNQVKSLDKLRDARPFHIKLLHQGQCMLCKEKWRGAVTMWGISAHSDCIKAHLVDIYSLKKQLPLAHLQSTIPYMFNRGGYGHRRMFRVWNVNHVAVSPQITLQHYKLAYTQKILDFAKSQQQEDDVKRTALAEARKAKAIVVLNEKKRWREAFVIAAQQDVDPWFVYKSYRSFIGRIPKELRAFVESTHIGDAVQRAKEILSYRITIPERLWPLVFSRGEDVLAWKEFVETDTELSSDIIDAIIMKSQQNHYHNWSKLRIAIVVKDVFTIIGSRGMRQGLICLPLHSISAMKVLILQLQVHDFHMIRRIQQGGGAMINSLFKAASVSVSDPYATWSASSMYIPSHIRSQSEIVAWLQTTSEAWMRCSCGNTPSPTCNFNRCQHCCYGLGCIRHNV